MTIQSIRVQQKFDLGEIWFNTDSGFPEPCVIASKPFYHEYLPGNGCWVIRLQDPVYGHIRQFFLGDLGVKGFAYDARPCKLVRTLDEAKDTIRAFDDWASDDRNF